jgi:hypothetical protein
MTGALISVVIPTYQRADLLERCLESLTAQTLARTQFEVVVVDDGSSDDTQAVCARLAEQLPLHSLRISNSGISAAKNLGLFASQAPLVLFFDDDDLAEPGLLEAHVEAHRTHPEESVAVLGYTTWAPELEITPVMRYVTEIGRLLFSYGDIEDGDLLDHTYFWGGRSSAKRAFLAQHGIFDQEFPAIIEDIELGFRLAEHGLSVLHTRSAKSLMVRPVTYDEFAERCVKRGRALWLFNSRHADPAVERYCRVKEGLATWRECEASLDERMARVRELERRHADAGGLDERSTSELNDLYRWTFDALQARGIAEAAAEAASASASHPRASAPGLERTPAVCPDPVFIIGSPRSGTTVLAHSLREHSELWASGESDMLFFLFADRFVEGVFDRTMAVPGPRWLRLEDVDREEFLAYVGMGLNALMTNRSGGLRWIDHTPLYTKIVDTLIDAFPGASFVHILRDGRDVVHSMLNFAANVPDPEVGRFLEHSVPWASDIRKACETWCEHVETATNFCERHPGRTTVVRYEDLVAAPEATFASIFGFLGIADEAGPARFLSSKRINSSFTETARPTSEELWSRWDAERRRVFTEVAGATMLRTGYYSTPGELGRLAHASRVGD